ncbi:MAG: hypothetical protein RLZZ453_588 [Chlamydiota bacterium]|jgi:predicted dienelactone hydrolase
MFTNRRVRWVLYSLLPLAFLLIPFTTSVNLSTHFRSLVLEPKKTGITTLEYFDEDRQRPLITEVWYPVDSATPSQAAAGVWIRCDEARDVPISAKQKKYPLIVMSHGSNGDRYNISWLAEALAANGYIVAAMDHYGNTWNNKIMECYMQPWERPKDISFVLDRLLQDVRFSEKIDAHRIGFAGYSLGGATGMWIAGGEMASLNFDLVKQHSFDEAQVVPDEVIQSIDFKKAEGSYRDPRIHAVMVMAPALGWAFSEDSLCKIDIPVLIIAPETDRIVPTERNAKIFASKIKKASLKILQGDATHYVFLNRATALGKRFMDRKYCEDPVSISRDIIHKDVTKQTLRFFDKNL